MKYFAIAGTLRGVDVLMKEQGWWDWPGLSLCERPLCFIEACAS